MGMLKFPLPLTSLCFFFFTLLTVINTISSARMLMEDSRPHDLDTPSLTFYMNNILGRKHESLPKVDSNQGLPFSKPLGFFSPNKGIPTSGLSTQTLDFPGLGIPFAARATLEEMEFGAITVIDEALFEGAFGSVLIGKAEGVYVASSEDVNSHMVAITVSFANDQYENKLRLFGLHRRGHFSESHVAVIGGTGVYENANGYAIIKNANVSSNVGEKESEETYSVLLLNVYL